VTLGASDTILSHSLSALEYCGAVKIAAAVAIMKRAAGETKDRFGAKDPKALISF
jgi:hypothetical protein